MVQIIAWLFGFHGDIYGCTLYEGLLYIMKQTLHTMVFPSVHYTYVLFTLGRQTATFKTLLSVDIELMGLTHLAADSQYLY